MKKIIFCLLLALPFFTFSQKPTVPQMLDKTLAGVVTVEIYQTDIAMRSLGFRGNSADLAYSKVLELNGAKASGSGFIITKNGKSYVITNAHVIEDASEKSQSIYVYSISYKKYEAK